MYGGLSVVAAPSPMQRPIQASPNAPTIDLAFVFDGPSDKNESVLQVFQKTFQPGQLNISMYSQTAVAMR